MIVCSLEDCNNKHLARGLCSKHYHKNYNKNRPPETTERKEAKSQWFKNNRQKVSETGKRSKSKHRARVYQELRRRRNLKYRAEGSHTEKEWQALMKVYKYTCLACKKTDVVLTRDHVIPLSKGGLDYITNIQPLCKPCNSSKHTKVTDYRLT